MPHETRSRTMTERCTLDGFVITPLDHQAQRNRENLSCMRSEQGIPQLASLTALRHALGLR